MHAAPCGRLDHLSKQSRQQLQKLLHQSCICQLCMVRCCEDTLSSRPEAHAVLTAGAKSGTSHIQRRQALVQLLLALQKQHESMHLEPQDLENFPTGIPELLLQVNGPVHLSYLRS